MRIALSSFDDEPCSEITLYDIGLRFILLKRDEKIGNKMFSVYPSLT